MNPNYYEIVAFVSSGRALNLRLGKTKRAGRRLRKNTGFMGGRPMTRLNMPHILGGVLQTA